MNDPGSAQTLSKRTAAPISALVSIHDVMPETLDQVQQLVDLCTSFEIGKLTLLVVPGRDWTPKQIAQLSQWSDQGYELAGHGWVHHCDRIIGIRHRVHSALISRNVAEHLSLTPQDSMKLIQRCSEWFSEIGLSHNGLYVPPAWALGTWYHNQLSELPFRQIETLTGIIFTETGRRRSLPLVGFEADTTFRRFFIDTFNRINVTSSMLRHRPLRISIHPRDHLLKLSQQLSMMLARPLKTMYYSELAQ